MGLVHFRVVHSNSRSCDLDVCVFDTIHDIMTLVRETLHLTGRFVLSYGGRDLIPEDFFSEIGFVRGSPINIVIKTHPHKARVPAAHSEPVVILPSDSSDDSRDSEDPPEFDQLVEALVDMGFTRGRAQACLRLVNYSFDKAVSMCLSRKGVESRRAKSQPQTKRKPSSKSKSRPKAAPPEWKQEDSDGDDEELTDGSSLSAADKKVLAEIQEQLQMDMDVIVQVYESCDRQKRATIASLRAML
jgi:hypothetical protein